MGLTKQSLSDALNVLTSDVAAIRARAGDVGPSVTRWLSDSAAVHFHLSTDFQSPFIVSIIGGTGTGKSTLVNRLLDETVSAASFRRTFTAGAVAVAHHAASIPSKWLGIDHLVAGAQEIPARGKNDVLMIVESANPFLDRISLIDTPDLDGDQPAHHAQADRVFRWSQALIFLVSPEKYQMTELLPYYRLARRYAVPALFVMNKCQTPEMLEDYRRLIESTVSSPGNVTALFSIARDDAGYEPPAEMNLSALRAALKNLQLPGAEQRASGNRVRTTDLLGRLRDSVLAPLARERADIDILSTSLKRLETPVAGVDVNPITEQLQRRLQQRSVLYLIGPGRVMDRVRQVPGMIVRLPRTAWDALFRGKLPDISSTTAASPSDESRNVPDFNETLVDQFRIVQSRIDDIVRSTATGERWLLQPDGYSQSRIDPQQAGRIADEALTELKDWLQRRWNATPRDTVLLLKLIRHLPGGEKLTQWTETAPYLLALIVAAHHALFGHIDLMILGGYSLATWLTERLSNEVAARTRQTNRDIAVRFGRLAHQQIEKTIAWIATQSPTAQELKNIQLQADALEELLEQ